MRNIGLEQATAETAANAKTERVPRAMPAFLPDVTAGEQQKPEPGAGVRARLRREEGVGSLPP
jgi:hypothetical protein